MDEWAKFLRADRRNCDLNPFKPVQVKLNRNIRVKSLHCVTCNESTSSLIKANWLDLFLERRLTKPIRRLAIRGIFWTHRVVDFCELLLHSNSKSGLLVCANNVEWSAPPATTPIMFFTSLQRWACQKIIKTQTIIICKAARCIFRHVWPPFHTPYFQDFKLQRRATPSRTSNAEASWRSRTVLSLSFFFPVVSLLIGNKLNLKGNLDKCWAINLSVWETDLWDSSSSSSLHEMEGFAFGFNVTWVLWDPSQDIFHGIEAVSFNAVKKL